MSKRRSNVGVGIFDLLDSSYPDIYLSLTKMSALSSPALAKLFSLD